MSKPFSENFDYLWNWIIYPAIQLCLSEMDQEFCDQSGKVYKNERIYRRELEEKFKEKEKWLVQKYLPEEENSPLSLERLGAILCRCIIGNKYVSYNVKIAEAIRRKKERANKKNRKSPESLVKWEIDNIYVNYKLAALVGEGLMYYDLLYWAQTRINQQISIENENQAEAGTTETESEEQKKRHSEIYNEMIYLKEELIKTKRLPRYDISEQHGDFYANLILALMKEDCQSRDFDYLSFAIILFQWKEYVKHRILFEFKNNSIINSMQTRSQVNVEEKEEPHISKVELDLNMAQSLIQDARK